MLQDGLLSEGNFNYLTFFCLLMVLKGSDDPYVVAALQCLSFKKHKKYLKRHQTCCSQHTKLELAMGTFLGSLHDWPFYLGSGCVYQSNFFMSRNLLYKHQFPLNCVNFH